jgi:hypothetical protein
MDSAEITRRFSRATIEQTFSTYLFGAIEFGGNPYEQGLAGVYCQALRFALLDELEGKDRTGAEALKDVVDNLAPDTPPEASEALKALSPDKFNEQYKILRIQAGEKGIDIAEFAEALQYAKDIASYCARLGAKPSPAASEPKKRPWWKIW